VKTVHGKTSFNKKHFNNSLITGLMEKRKEVNDERPRKNLRRDIEMKSLVFFPGK
jgi:hypothetical protein